MRIHNFSDFDVRSYHIWNMQKHRKFYGFQKNQKNKKNLKKGLHFVKESYIIHFVVRHNTKQWAIAKR